MNYTEKDIEAGAVALYVTITTRRTSASRIADAERYFDHLSEDSKETWREGARAVLEAADARDAS